MDEQINELFPFVKDNGYNSTFYSDNILYRYSPDINTLVNKKEIESEIKSLLKD